MVCFFLMNDLQMQQDVEIVLPLNYISTGQK